MASKQVTDRQKSTRFVVAAAETHGEELQRSFEQRFGASLKKGEKMPDVALLSQLVARSMHSATEALVAADKAHEAELADDAEPRAHRDDEAQHVYQTLVDLRGAVGAALGQDALHLLGIDHATPSDPSVLLTEGEAVLEKLRNKALKLPPHRRKGIRFEASDFADELEAHLDPLKRALNDVAREVREGQKTLQDKRKAMAEHDRIFSTGASWLSSTFAVVGHDELAAKVRPAPRHPGQVEDPTEEAPAPAKPS